MHSSAGDFMIVVDSTYFNYVLDLVEDILSMSICFFHDSPQFHNITM